jgi:hypothetical protein
MFQCALIAIFEDNKYIAIVFALLDVHKLDNIGMIELSLNAGFLEDVLFCDVHFG